MKTEHTPGPWMFGIRGDKKPIEKPFNYHGPGYYDNPSIFGADGTEIAGCDEYMIFNKEEDIRLIAAAPDLLEALVSMVFSCDWNDREGKLAFDVAYKAIAKATGQA